jgi:hypothetical protein
MLRSDVPSFDPALRIAVLTPNLTFRQILQRARKCRAIAGSVPVLREVAEAVAEGRLALGPVEAAVIAFTGIRHGELTELERDLFWRVFQVPVFEQFLASDGRVLAMECDAHEGLHLLEPDAPLPGFRARLDTAPCGCGNAHPRLIRLERLERLAEESKPAPVVLPAAHATHVYDDREEEDQQVNAAGRVA